MVIGAASVVVEEASIPVDPNGPRLLALAPHVWGCARVDEAVGVTSLVLADEDLLRSREHAAPHVIGWLSELRRALLRIGSYPRMLRDVPATGDAESLRHLPARTAVLHSPALEEPDVERGTSAYV